MHANADLDRSIGERTSQLACRLKRPGGGRKGCEERVSLCVDLHAVMAEQGGSNCVPMVRQRRGVIFGPELLQEARRGLHVREEEGDCSRRQLRHSQIMRHDPGRSKSCDELKDEAHASRLA